jgi:hypothetical protein
MVRPTCAIRTLWESTYCALLRRTLIQPSRSKSSLKFSSPGPLPSSYRPRLICPTSNRKMSRRPSTISALRWLYEERVSRGDHE